MCSGRRPGSVIGGTGSSIGTTGEIILTGFVSTERGVCAISCEPLRDEDADSFSCFDALRLICCLVEDLVRDITVVTGEIIAEALRVNAVEGIVAVVGFILGESAGLGL